MRRTRCRTLLRCGRCCFSCCCCCLARGLSRHVFIIIRPVRCNRRRIAGAAQSCDVTFRLLSMPAACSAHLLKHISC
jgi:hypothetical protein